MELEQQDLSRMLETAVVAARLAGQRAMEDIHSVKVTVKNGTELVTEADRRCQQIIIDRVKETFPDHGFIGEEGEQGKLFKRSPRDEPALWWVIDPIDGTTNFAHGIPMFAVSIAVLFEGRPIVGVIFHPTSDSMYTAVAGGEAHLNGRRLQAGQEELNPLASVGLDSHFDNPLPAWVGTLIHQSRFRNFGTTALHLAYTAAGGLVGAVACTPKLWDIAAGVVIAEAAGAVITNWQGQALFPVDPDAYEGEPFQVLAANKTAHPKLVAILGV